MVKGIENIKIEGARIVFRNLSGKPDKFNPQGGKRTFAVVIDDPEFAQSLKEEGWNLKQFRARDDEEGDPGHYLQVKVNFNNRPPHIYLCTGRSKTLLTEDTVGSLDYADISNVDVVISPFEYNDIGGKSGVAAYVKTMYVSVVEDEFASKYDYDDEPEELPF